MKKRLCVNRRIASVGYVVTEMIYDWVGKGVHREVFKRLTDWWYMHTLQLENKTYKILCDFQIPTNHQTPDRKPNILLVNMAFTVYCTLHSHPWICEMYIDRS